MNEEQKTTLLGIVIFNPVAVCALLALFFSVQFIQAQPADTSGIRKKIRFKIEPAVEYLTPTHPSRNIQTVSFNFWGGLEFFRKTPLTVCGGITATYAWGTITRWDENFQDVAYKNKAFGAGPALLLRFEPFVYKGFSVAPEASVGLILYSRKFPYGGDIYNFMSRIGGSVNYRINKKYAVNLNGKWMHVSNGQGLGEHNPSYEAWGFGVGFARYF
jgi:lipid A 3-O-deacylase